MHSEAMPRVIGLRSSAQNCSEAIAAFQIEYSHTSGQYSAVSMVVVVKFCKTLMVAVLIICMKNFIGNIYWFEGICMNGTS